MPQKKKFVKTYGKRSRKTVISDNWLSSDAELGLKSSNAFSDESADSSTSVLVEKSVLKDATNKKCSEKELCNLLWSKFELSRSSTSPELVPETPEHKMATAYKRKLKTAPIDNESFTSKDQMEGTDLRKIVMKKSVRSRCGSNADKENKRNKTDLMIIDEVVDDFIIQEKKPILKRERRTELRKIKNIKKKGRRVSIFHSSLMNSEDKEEDQFVICSPCEVMLSRLALDDLPESSSPVVLSPDVSNIFEICVQSTIGDYIPEDLSPVLEPIELEHSILRSNAGHIQESLTPLKGKRGKVFSAREKVLAHCGQSKVLPFLYVFTEKELKDSLKIGEGVYGEVFKIERNNETLAVKIIPIEGDLIVNDENQKTFEEMLPEIVISKELSSLRIPTIQGQTNHFIELKAVQCCCGRFPPQLLKKWDEYDDRKCSENDRPDSYTDTQLFIVFVFADGGTDLESFKFDNVMQLKSVLQQTVGALAVAEATLQFEHRDLHWGNILIKKYKASDHKQSSIILGQEGIDVLNSGLQVSIIDFTLSRLHKDGCTLFFDLSTDQSLFEGEGDYQFDIYRLMKSHNNNKWDSFNAYNNVLWIHYVIKKLLEEKRLKRTLKKLHREMLQQLKNFERETLNFKSALDILRNSSLFDS